MDNTHDDVAHARLIAAALEKLNAALLNANKEGLITEVKILEFPELIGGGARQKVITVDVFRKIE